MYISYLSAATSLKGAKGTEQITQSKLESLEILPSSASYGSFLSLTLWLLHHLKTCVWAPCSTAPPRKWSRVLCARRCTIAIWHQSYWREYHLSIFFRTDDWCGAQIDSWHFHRSLSVPFCALLLDNVAWRETANMFYIPSGWTLSLLQKHVKEQKAAWLSPAGNQRRLSLSLEYETDTVTTAARPRATIVDLIYVVYLSTRHVRYALLKSNYDNSIRFTKQLSCPQGLVQLRTSSCRTIVDSPICRQTMHLVQWPFPQILSNVGYLQHTNPDVHKSFVQKIQHPHLPKKCQSISSVLILFFV